MEHSKNIVINYKWQHNSYLHSNSHDPAAWTKFNSPWLQQCLLIQSVAFHGLRLILPRPGHWASTGLFSLIWNLILYMGTQKLLFHSYIWLCSYNAKAVISKHLILSYLYSLTITSHWSRRNRSKSKVHSTFQAQFSKAPKQQLIFQHTVPLRNFLITIKVLTLYLNKRISSCLVSHVCDSHLKHESAP